jgi:hypothetical protein
MREFNDLLIQITRIADSLDKIANAHGMTVAAPMAETAPAPAATAETPKKRGPKPRPASEVAPAAPVEVPVVEDLFGGDDAAAPVEYTADDVKGMLTLALKNMPQEDVAKLFKANNGGVARVSDMDPKFYGPVVELFKTALENLPGE